MWLRSVDTTFKSPRPLQLLLLLFLFHLLQHRPLPFPLLLPLPLGFLFNHSTNALILHPLQLSPSLPPPPLSLHPGHALFPLRPTLPTRHCHVDPPLEQPCRSGPQLRHRSRQLFIAVGELGDLGAGADEVGGEVGGGEGRRGGRGREVVEGGELGGDGVDEREGGGEEGEGGRGVGELGGCVDSGGRWCEISVRREEVGVFFIYGERRRVVSRLDLEIGT